MKWMLKWIGKRYAKLWTHFKEELFTYKDAELLLKTNTSNVLSDLKKYQALVVFEKEGGKRKYRLISPEIYIYSYAYKIHLESLPQTQFAHLLVKFFYVLKENLGENLLSLGLFGSVAKGTAQMDSDIDLYIITENTELSLVERTEYFLKLKHDDLISQEIEFLHSQGYNAKINFISKEKNNLSTNFFTIDITFDMIVLFDIGILKQFLVKNKKIIKEQGIQKKFYEKEKYYLDLNIKFGEIFEF
jgi:hypothetical protein